ncbi:MAG: hypothetical protein JNN01_02325 [Opitutaceae bacterium]|nr:hypothetical protein [Opitutaceae bacterium]
MTRFRQREPETAIRRNRIGRWIRGCAGLAAFATLSAAPTTSDGFAIPLPGTVFQFPRDHGAHPEFRLEWWYVTGHLLDAQQRRVGFQATFFRQVTRDRATQVHLAHMALVDPVNRRFYHQERLNRDGWDAQADTQTLSVRNGPWSLRMVEGTQEEMELAGGVRSELRFLLRLVPRKPLVVFGEQGVSRKGEDPAAASHYLTFSRLAVSGTLAIGEEPVREVTGEAWMDHEISSSQLSANQVGWDWVSLQLRDEPRELMLYLLRRADGSADPASTLQWVSPEGRAERRTFVWEVLSTWRSPDTGAVYPARIRLTTEDPKTGLKRAFTLEPLLPNQELTGGLAGIAYWEGACRVLDSDGRDVGSAYMELTGYAAPLKL